MTALRISQGRSTEPIGSDLPVVKDALGQPLIPGSSFKGALRSRTESFLRGINPELARDPSELVSPAVSQAVTQIKQEVKDAKPEEIKDKDQELTKRLYDMTDDASKVFGSPWQASKFQVRDLTVQPETWFGQYQERDGVSIDRDTETAVDGRLYDFQVVPAGVQFEFRAVCENAESWELGLIAMGLQQFKRQQIPLGGGNSRGLGVVQLDITEVTWVDPEDAKALLKYMENLSLGQLGQYQHNDISHIEALMGDWISALISHLSPQAQAAVASPSA